MNRSLSRLAILFRTLMLLLIGETAAAAAVVMRAVANQHFKMGGDFFGGPRPLL